MCRVITVTGEMEEGIGEKEKAEKKEEESEIEWSDGRRRFRLFT